MKKLIIYTDGGARGNPGHAAIGVAVFVSGQHKPVKVLGKYIGQTTNNQAEYHALLLGLQEAEKLGAEELVCFLDSELIVRQLTGKYKIKELGLQELAGQVFKIQNSFKRVDYRHVPREKNKLADQLVNKTLDDAGY